MDAAGEGFVTHPDEYYRQWPHPISDEEMKTYGFLKPMSQQEVLGAFLAIRAGCLTSMKKFDEAAQSWEAASRHLRETPVLNQIVEHAKERAGNVHKAERWDELWDQVVRQPIPVEPKQEYFQDRQAQVLLFMSHTTDMTAIEQAVARLKSEVDEYAQAMTTDTHKVQFRISFIPPPMRLLQNPEQDELSALTGGFMPQSSRIRIRAERMPHEYWQSIPPELQRRLNGLRNEEQIVSEMNSYYVEEVNRRNRAIMEQMTAKPAQPTPPNVRSELLPAEYRESMPDDLRKRLANLNSDGQVWAEVQRYQLERENARRSEEMKAMMMQPFTPGVPNLPLTTPPVRIEIIPPQTGER